MGKARKLPETLTEAERTALLSIPNTRYPTGTRNLAIMYCMIDGGLRCSEVVGKEDGSGGGIRVNHVNFTTGKIRIENAKGGSDRYIYLQEKALEVIQAWYDIRPESTTDLLFITLKGKKISNRYIRRMIDRLSKRAGIDKKIHPHSLRHTFATDIYKDTKNILLVQKALGHANVSTTQIYTHVADQEVETAMQCFRKKR